MRIEFEIPDERVHHFTNSAKARLIDQAEKYTIEVISEAEKVEELIRENGASQEITDNIVFQAVRRNKTAKKKKTWVIVVRVIAELLLFIAGLMFLPEQFITQEGTLNVGYLIAFIVVALIASIATIVTYFIGGE